MATDISPILGITLLEFIDAATIASICVAIGIFGSIAANVYLSHKERGQTRLAESARLAIELQKEWKGESEFTSIVGKLKERGADFSGERPNVGYVLGVFEDLAILWRDKTLTETHVREFFGRDIVRIGANESVMAILDEARQKNPKNTYNNLVKLLEASKTWGMDPLFV